MEVTYSYVSVDMFSRKFKESYGKKQDEELSEPYDKSQIHKNALSFSVCKGQIWLESSTVMDLGPKSPNNKFVESGRKS